MAEARRRTGSAERENQHQTHERWRRWRWEACEMANGTANVRRWRNEMESRNRLLLRAGSRFGGRISQRQQRRTQFQQTER